MLKTVIPNYEDEVARLRGWGPEGFIMGFNFTIRGPEYLHSEYDLGWQRVYEEENFFFVDPVSVWIMNHSGYTRWSEIKIPDIRGVLAKARSHNLVYGAVFSRLVNHKRSFLSLGRSDRELTDIELEVINTRFEVLTDMVVGRSDLAPGELEVLQLLKDGHGQREIADALGIAESTVKQRSIKACRKLGARTRTQAVAIAVARNYFQQSPGGFSDTPIGHLLR